MSVSANTEPWYGNQDTEQRFPLKNHRDKVNYVLSFTQIRRVQVGKQVQIVEANDIARVQVFTPHDYERIVNPGKSGGGKGENFFERNKNVKVTILHDPTKEVFDAKPDSKKSGKSGKSGKGPKENKPKEEEVETTEENLGTEDVVDTSTEEGGQDA